MKKNYPRMMYAFGGTHLVDGKRVKYTTVKNETEEKQLLDQFDGDQWYVNLGEMPDKPVNKLVDKKKRKNKLAPPVEPPVEPPEYSA